MTIKYKSYPAHAPMVDSNGFLTPEWQEYFDRDNVDTNSEQTLENKLVDLVSNIFGTVNQITITDNGDNTVTLSTPQDIATTSAVHFGRTWAGSSGVFEAFYRQDGDKYTDGKTYAMGITSRAERFGTGFQLLNNTPATQRFYLDIDATFTVATATIEKTGQTFISDGVEVGMVLILTSGEDGSSVDYTGAVGEILSLTEETIVVSVAASGVETISDLTGVNFVAYPNPIMLILDNGDIHFNVGSNPDARMHIEAPYGTGESSVAMSLVAGVEGNTGLDLGYDAKSIVRSYGMHINFDATEFDTAEHEGRALDVVVLNTGATAGDFHAMDVAKADPTDDSIEAEAVATQVGVAPVAQYLADAATLDAGFIYDASLATYTDSTTAFKTAGTDVQIFVGDNDQILLAATAKWDNVSLLLQTASSQTIIPTFEYVKDDGTWVAFSPSDETAGFQQDGIISWNKDNLTDWGQRTVNEVTGEVGAVDYYWIRITRTRNILPRPPTESLVSISTKGSKFAWNEDGDVNINTVSVVDGVTAPDAIVGESIIYTDGADGVLKVKHGDGTVKVLE